MEIVPSIRRETLEEIEFLYKALSNLKGDFSKPISKEVLGKSLEFAKGMFYQREIDLKEILDLKNKHAVKVSRLRAQVALFQSQFMEHLDA